MLRRISSVGALALLSFPTVFAASSNPTCPESHGTEYTSSNGNIYQIVCGTDTKGNDISHVEVKEANIHSTVQALIRGSDPQQQDRGLRLKM